LFAPLLVLTVALQAQVEPAKSVKFEVASVRANKSGDLAMPARTRGRTYTATNMPVRYLVASAYGVPAARVLGGPAWIGSASVAMPLIGGERFDVLATLPEGVGPNDVPSMLRVLLAERFNLVAHIEMREAPMYALVVDRTDRRLGPRLRQASIDCDAVDPATMPAAKPGERGPCGSELGGEIIGRGQRLTTLARMLSFFAGRPVVDRTNLAGGFDFDLRFPELDTPPDGRNAGDAGGGIFVAVQEQLGLKLEPIRGPLEFVVIDSVERPAEN
jgi:uncharacterized protein (TIGR03435 family)